jgi:TolA-binding protein
MERLKDAHFEVASLEAEAGLLLRGSEPYSVPPSLKRNVRVRLVEAAPRRRMPVWLRVAIAAGVLGVVAISGAAAGRAWKNPPAAAFSVIATNASSARPSAPRALEASVVSVSREPQAAAVSPAASAVKRTVSDAHVDARRDPAPASEASLVYETARALRNEGDAARAARVLDDYFKRYPHGALAEEARALAIDIAVARGDARAKGLASRYLASYPNGHFRAKAERVLGAD